MMFWILQSVCWSVVCAWVSTMFMDPLQNCIKDLDLYFSFLASPIYFHGEVIDPEDPITLYDWNLHFNKIHLNSFTSALWLIYSWVAWLLLLQQISVILEDCPFFSCDLTELVLSWWQSSDYFNEFKHG